MKKYLFSIKDKNNTKDYFAMLLWFAVLVELLFYIYANLFRILGGMECDLSKLMYHTIQMVKQHTVFICDWSYVSTLELDCNALFAIPVYLITGNIFISFGVAAICNIFLWLAVIIRLCQNIEIDSRWTALLCQLFFVPWSWGGTETTNMLFFAGGQYTYKVILPFLVILMITMPEEDKNTWKYKLWFTVGCLLAFITGISSGVYVLATALLPIVLCIILLYCYGWRSAHPVFIIGVLLSELLGILIQKMHNVIPKANEFVLVSNQDFFPNLLKTWTHLFSMFETFPEKTVGVMSFAGIIAVIRIGIVFLLLFCGLRTIRFWGAITVTRSKETVDPRLLAESIFVTIFVWNFSILMLTESTPRYHMIGAYPLIFGGVLQLYHDLETRENQKGNIIWLLAVSLGLWAVCGFQWKEALVNYFVQRENNVQIYSEALEKIDHCSDGTVFVCNVSELAEQLQLFDEDKLIISVEDEDIYHPWNIDDYIAKRDRSFYTDRNVLIDIKENVETWPQELKNLYTKQDEFWYKNQLYEIYVSDVCIFDGLAGLPLKGYGESTDLPNTEGYVFNGRIDEQGQFVAEGSGAILESPAFAIANDEITVLIRYQNESDEVFLTLYKDGGEVEQLELPKDDKEISLHISDSGEYRYVIEKGQPGQLMLDSFSYVRD